MKSTLTALLILGTATIVHAEGFTLVTTTDFATGSTSSIDRAAHTSVNDVEPICSDAVARWFGAYVYIVNRGCDNIQILDPDNNFQTVDQFSTGNGSNPHDIWVNEFGTVGYITRYNMTSIVKMDLTNGATLGIISLASFADADGIPEMDQVFRQSNILWVTVQLLDRNNFYSPTGTSYVVKIDMNTDTVVDTDPIAPGVQAIPLLHTNPYSEVVHNFGDVTHDLALSAVGFFGVNDAGILRISSGNAANHSLMLSESAAGGDILDFAIISQNRGYAIVANASFETILIQFNPATGTKTGATIYNPGGYHLSDLEIGVDLLVADGTPTNPGVRFFDTADNTQILPNPLDVGLPPFDILEVPILCVGGGCGTAVGDTPRAATLGQNYPNPFNPETSIPFSLTKGGQVMLRIYDVHGAYVATLLDERRDAGEHIARWNGRTDAGAVAPTGIYFVRLQAGGTIETRKLALLK